MNACDVVMYVIFTLPIESQMVPTILHVGTSILSGQYADIIGLKPPITLQGRGGGTELNALHRRARWQI